ncbi:MAG: ABC transporter permease [Lachnospiraceae bacterium]
MNLFYFELKLYLKSAIGWLISVVAILILLMVGLFPLYMNAEEEINQILQNFSPVFAQAFGIAISDMFTFGGFYNFSFGYISLLAGVMAASLAITVFAREKKAKCLDFILTKPMSRKGIFLYKLAMSLAVLISFNLIYNLVFLWIYQVGGDNGVSFGSVLHAGMGLLYTQLVFLAVGILFGVLARRIRSVSGTATIVGLAAFILSSLANVLDDEKMDYIAPLKYFAPDRIFKGDNYQASLVVAAFIIITACLAIAFTKFVNSDARQV